MDYDMNLTHCNLDDDLNTLEFDSFGYWRCKICGTVSKDIKLLSIREGLK